MTSTPFLGSLSNHVFNILFWLFFSLNSIHRNKPRSPEVWPARKLRQEPLVEPHFPSKAALSVVRAVKLRNAAKFTEWSTESSGALSASGRKLALDSAIRNT
jgi:hypothetical protein